jgi:hypothetical protein
MKLYAWQPREHGPLSFFVMADDEADARAAIDAAIESKGLRGADVDGWRSADGWAYQLTIAEAGQVLTNDNS